MQTILFLTAPPVPHSRIFYLIRVAGVPDHLNSRSHTVPAIGLYVFPSAHPRSRRPIVPETSNHIGLQRHGGFSQGLYHQRGTDLHKAWERLQGLPKTVVGRPISNRAASCIRALAKNYQCEQPRHSETTTAPGPFHISRVAGFAKALGCNFGALGLKSGDARRA